ncbi:lysophospholipid acyltransferase family protein [Daejeonella oryzae]|uniref:lysophospholipid acyltransferase family protein n=1 Tax=Daejeonella oryzae TaxID=1122943 RepID=UPI00047ACDBD|nr:lysophospholipid acyltransferase family protein [Daejeonella oryzae]
MKFIERISSAVFLIWCALVFTLSMMVVFPFIILFTTLFKGKTGHRIGFLFLKLWAYTFSTLCFFFIKSNSKEVDRSKSYIYICNHNSYLDAVAMVVSTPQPFKPLGKIELLKAPIFGMIYKRMVVLINRKDKESRARSVESLKTELAFGLSILIFPEGTMNRSEIALAEFYDGAFRLAIETQTALLPVAIINARNLLPRKNMLLIKPGQVTCVYGKPIEVLGMTEKDLPQLKEKAYRILEEMIIKGES